jgi:hypothetical protein
MERLLGHDFSQVRVHADDRAGVSAREVNARAYTVRSDVVFAPGQYAAHTTEGRKLLGHELTHVIQQGGRSRSPGTPLSIAPAGSMLEQQAQAASTFSSNGANGAGGSIRPTLPTPTLQRAEADEAPAEKEAEAGCAGWMEDRESTTKRAAEVYVRSELTDDHGEVVTIGNCSPEGRVPADFACTVTFKSGLRVRVVVSRGRILVGVEPLNSPSPERPICFYKFHCPEPTRDLVLTKERCITTLAKPKP